MDGQLTDKDLHCIARTVQTRVLTGDCVGCKYCKYAFECAEPVNGKLRPYFLFGLSEKLETLTGVKVHFIDIRNASRHYTSGSWMEEYPEFKNTFINLPPDSQEGILANKGIFEYIRNPSLLERLLEHDLQENKP